MQSKKMSFVESWANVAIGFGINFFGQLFIFPLVGMKAHLGQNLLVGLFFTVLSIVRSYCLRRYFNRLPHKDGYTRFKFGPTVRRLPGQKPRA